MIATFPTCHDPTLRELLRLGLPQRRIAIVHNPEFLNDTSVAQVGVGGVWVGVRWCMWVGGAGVLGGGGVRAAI